MAEDYRIGHGFDAHQFEPGRRLILGGVEVPSDAGLIGHSDADVLLHALMNALLGAVGKGDIGIHFPDADPRYKGIASGTLLKRVLKIIGQGNWKIVNADITLLAQKPRLAPFFDEIRTSLATLLKVKQERLNIKAATTEELGWIGRGEGMAAIAVVLLRK
jgi:2-C-methyl-D-erythritol 2,4-cyclodiphosphate synthase